MSFLLLLLQWLVNLLIIFFTYYVALYRLSRRVFKSNRVIIVLLEGACFTHDMRSQLIHSFFGFQLLAFLKIVLVIFIQRND